MKVPVTLTTRTRTTGGPGHTGTDLGEWRGVMGMNMESNELRMKVEKNYQEAVIYIVEHFFLYESHVYDSYMRQ